MGVFRWFVILLQVGSIAALAQQSEAWAQQADFERLRDASRGDSTPRIVNEPRGVVVPGADANASGSRGTSAAQSESPPQAAVPPSSPGDKTEFQFFVESSVGRELPLFGHNFFTTAPSTFAPIGRVSVPSDYVVGPGDEIIVRAWGQIDIDYSAVVDRNGKIFLPKVGELQVAGMHADKLDGYVGRAVGKVFKNFDLNVTLGELRSIQIFVVGQARRPGSYVVGSLSTLGSALFASGGPSYKGSMRRIQLKRGSKVVREFDLYDFLLRGDRSKSVKLLAGDVIFIPPVGPLAAVTGSVQVPAIYELKRRSTLGDAISMAGGLATTASAKKVTIERIVNRETRFVEEFSLDAEGRKRRLRDGDVVNVHTLSPRIANAVTLRGNVAETMRFPWYERMRVSDVLPEKSALIVPDYWLQKNRAGRPESWLRDDDYWLQQNRVGGPESGPRDGNAGSESVNAEQLRRSLVRGGIEINWEYAVIERLNMEALEPTLIPFNLREAVVEKDKEHDLLLLPGDVITVFSADDIRVPKSRRTHFVRLEGEFMAPGVYQIKAGETLQELVRRVGGFTGNAYLFGSQFTRESARVEQQEKLDSLVARLEAEAAREQLQSTQSAITPEDAASLEQQAVAQRALIERYRSIKATGRIVLGIGGKGSSVNNLPDLPLEDGDSLLVPSLPGTVNVFGAVYNQNAYIYRNGNNVGNYLGRAGGPTRDADKKSIYLLRADGTVVSTQQQGWLGNIKGEPMKPGDSIIVPEQLTRFSLNKALQEWAQIFYQFALGVAAIGVLKDF
jgi:protein involved in polysaccharide export with SLBB domain